MEKRPTGEEIAGAGAYEELHVPALFQEWTARVLEAADVRAGHRVLDVACGTGVLSRSAAERVGNSGEVTGIDPNPGMLAVARRLSSGIRWKEGVAEDLPAEDASFERVVSQFGMMFFTDRGAAVEEMLRVLVPEGRLAVAVWDSLANTPAYAQAVDLLDRMAGPDAAYALRAPFVMGDRAALEQLLRDAGAHDVEGATHLGRARFPSLRAMVEADLRGWLPVMGVNLEEDLILAILSEAEKELAEYVVSNGRVEFASPAHIVSGRKVGGLLATG
ncbi:MAG: methyltransferase domain-containing protein [Gemmatimonadetes bacterium]|nr:methyltransferase domain-containing protein [Gemmatimonadota bacterium]NNF14891.1 methyltransferase domain-containing protein [Gemmatimonadota bacterium]